MGLLALALTIWLFGGGAERLAAHPGLMYSRSLTSPRRIQVAWAATLVWNGFVAFLLFRGFPFNMQSGGAYRELFPVLFPFAFAGMWILVVSSLGWMSGWTGLAENYPGEPRYEGALVWASGKIGGVGYNGVIRLGANDAGLHLAVLLLFRLGHPPICIPWRVVEISSEKQFFTEYVRFQVGETKIDIRKRDIVRLTRKQRLPGPLQKLVG